MEQAKQSPGRPTGVRHGLTKSIRFQEQDAATLRCLAAKWGCSEAAVVRRLLREEADRANLGRDPGSTIAIPRAAEEAAAYRPIWEEIQEVMRQVPEEDLDTLPTDLAQQHDHYLYGTPKR